jgi:hypothetical protein
MPLIMIMLLVEAIVFAAAARAISAVLTWGFIVSIRTQAFLKAR